MTGTEAISQLEIDGVNVKATLALRTRDVAAVVSAIRFA
jgi:hypothetical protein